MERARDPTNANSSWLQLWWNQLGYLQVRDPVIINVSYFFHFADDPTLAVSSSTNETASAADAQIQRGAAILTAVGHFRKQVCSGTLPAETVGKGDRSKTLCSAAYKYMFHGCRIPALTQDSYKIYDPALHHHAIVAVQGHFFTVDLCDPVTADPYSVYELEAALRECRERAASLVKEEGGPSPPQLGWLTSSHRDDWAQARATLLQQGGAAMERALERLESGAVLLNLDDDPAVSRAQCAEKMLHGGLTAGGNRWFDKSIQLIVARNGKAGLLGEHSMMDGMPVVSLADRITRTTYRDACVQSSKSNGGASSSSSCRVETIFPSSLQQKVQGVSEPLVEKGTSTTIKTMSYYQGTIITQQAERSVSYQTTD